MREVEMVAKRKLRGVVGHGQSKSKPHPFVRVKTVDGSEPDRCLLCPFPAVDKVHNGGKEK